MPEPIPFDAYLEAVATASPPRNAVAGLAQVPEDRRRDEFDRLKRFVLDLYQGARPSRTDRGPDNCPTDWFAVADQPSYQRLSAREKRAAARPPAFQGLEPARKPDHESRALVAPRSRRSIASTAEIDGLIPMRRLSLARLARFGSLDAWRRKAPAALATPRTGPSAAVRAAVALPEVHRYAHACVEGSGPFTGASGWFNVWKPRAEPGVFSLAQLWMTSGDDPAGPLVQTIESGWQVYPDHYGHDRPALFLYFTTAGYDPSYGGSRGYNLEVPGFVQTSSRWALGAPLPGWSRPGPGGEQLGLGLHWRRDAGSGLWWLFIESDTGPEPFGFYPGSLFRRGALAASARFVDFGGEVAGRPGQTGTGAMGSGAMAGSGYGRAAFIKRVATVNTTGQVTPARLVAQPGVPGRYSLIARHNDPSWGTHLFYGGPGWS
jgi:hypothetical protein